MLRDGSGSETHSGLDEAIKIIFNHPNVGPFVCRHLIKHFVTSNPTAGYIKRIATVFNDDGNGTRGNLKAVLKGNPSRSRSISSIDRSWWSRKGTITCPNAVFACHGSKTLAENEIHHVAR